MRSLRLLPLFVLLLMPASAIAQASGPGSTGVASRIEGVLPLRARPAVQDAWLKERLETILPTAMRLEGIDMWIVDNREYNEDPVFFSLMPGTTMAARRRTILVFYDPGPGKPIERMAVSRYAIGDFYKGVWDPETEPDQYEALARIVRERDPKRIALNVSKTTAFGDGLSASSRANIRDAIGQDYVTRLTEAERLCVRWLEARSRGEMERYDDIARITHEIIKIGFSSEVVRPGITTSQDVVWWFRQAFADLDVGTWFQPSVDIIRRDGAHPEAPDGVIMPGDILHCDVGIVYLGLCTDVQQMAYVLNEGETDAPPGLKRALENANRAQDILVGNMLKGRTGNEILAATKSQMRRDLLDGSIYTHPIGFRGHAAGPLIGMWDMQLGVPGVGEYPLRANTLHSIELNAVTAIPEWSGQRITVGLEQEGFFDGESVRFLDRRQTAYHLIK